MAAAGLHASRDSFYRTTRSRKQDRSGVTTFPLELLPRRCPLCGNRAIIGHGQRRKQPRTKSTTASAFGEGCAGPVARHSPSCPPGRCRRATTAFIAGSRQQSESSNSTAVRNNGLSTSEIQPGCRTHPRCGDGRRGGWSACGLRSRADSGILARDLPAACRIPRLVCQRLESFRSGSKCSSIIKECEE